MCFSFEQSKPEKTIHSCVSSPSSKARRRSVTAFLKLAVLNGSTWFCSSPAAGGMSRVVPSSNTGGLVIGEAGEVMMMS